MELIMTALTKTGKLVRILRDERGLLWIRYVVSDAKRLWNHEYYDTWDIADLRFWLLNDGFRSVD